MEEVNQMIPLPNSDRFTFQTNPGFAAGRWYEFSGPAGRRQGLVLSIADGRLEVLLLEGRVISLQQDLLEMKGCLALCPKRMFPRRRKD